MLSVPLRSGGKFPPINSGRSWRLSPVSFLALFILPLSLDFRSGEAGGGWWQYLLAALTILAWGAVVYSGGVLRSRGRFWRATTWVLLFTLGGSVVPLVLNGVSFEHYGRVILPYFLFAMAFVVGVTEAVRGRVDRITKLMLWGCAVSTLFTVAAGFAISGADVDAIRYQILSPVLLPFEALLLHNIIAARNRVGASLLALTMCIALQILSVTRSAVLACSIVAIGAIWVTTPSALAFARRLARLAVPVAAAGAAAFAMTVYVAPEVSHRWQERIFASGKMGIDPTTFSRLAEIEDQIDRWSSTPATILFGRGYGANFGWSRAFYDVLLEGGVFQLRDIDREHFVAGHNFWVWSLFSGGIVFGVAFPVLLVFATWKALSSSRQMQKMPESTRQCLQISRCGLVLLALLAMTIGGNPLGSRYSALIGGLALGVVVAMLREVAVCRGRLAVPIET